ncbi:MAG: hypothetical protein A3F46_07955 [Legionellales bacterium RIFCSPHIGHO2_12_FULL_42_9]|nr:MAG: hypothetical protein A3F46_07955 [Legionellales bacterium RIFCSPHIGHO2_12_FULL_42_9]
MPNSSENTQPNYILDVVDAFKKLIIINEFDLSDTQLYYNAMTAYENFMYGFCHDILTSLNIKLDAEFYKYKYLTCVKYTSDAVLTVDLVAQALAPHLTAPDSALVDKLNKGQSIVNTLLTDANRRYIIRGVYKLEWLLAETVDQPRCSEYFRNNFHSGKNPLIDFLRTITVLSAGLSPENVTRDLVARQGTRGQRFIIAALNLECQAYQDYLQKRLGLNGPSAEAVPLLSEPKKHEKLRMLTTLTDILNDDTKNAECKIEEFKTVFEASKKTLSEHTDGRGLLFLKRTAYIISSLFLGAGLLYSYASKGTCNFFKSKGELAVEKIEACLPREKFTQNCH